MPNFWDKVRRGLGDEDEDLSALAPGVDLEMASFAPQPPPPIMPPSPRPSIATPTPIQNIVIPQQRIRLPGMLPNGVTAYYREVYGLFQTNSNNLYASPVTTPGASMLNETAPPNTYFVIRRFTPYIMEFWGNPTFPDEIGSMKFSQHFVATIHSNVSNFNANENSFAMINGAGTQTVNVAGGGLATNDTRSMSTSIFNKPAFDPDWIFIIAPTESLDITIRTKTTSLASLIGSGSVGYMAAVQLFGWQVPQSVFDQMVK